MRGYRKILLSLLMLVPGLLMAQAGRDLTKNILESSGQTFTPAGRWDFTGKLLLPHSSTPPSADCDESGEKARIYIDDDLIGAGSSIFICNGTGGWIQAAGGGGGGAPAFSAIQNGTNTAASMVVGNGASLSASGSGSIVASGVQTNAVTGAGISIAGESIGEIMYFLSPDWVHLANGAAGTVLASGGVGAPPTWASKPDDITVNGQAVQDAEFNATTPAAPGGNVNVTFQSSGTNPTLISGYVPSGGTPAFSSVTAGTNTTAAMLVGTGASLGVTGTGQITASKLPIGGSLTCGSGNSAKIKIGTSPAGVTYCNSAGASVQKYLAEADSSYVALNALVATTAGEADSLAADPTDCAGGTFATAIDAGGNLTCASASDATKLPLAGGTMTGGFTGYNVGDIFTIPSWQTSQYAPAIRWNTTGLDAQPWRMFVQNGASSNHDHVLITANNLKINEDGTYTRDDPNTPVIQWNVESRYLFSGDPTVKHGVNEWNLNIDPNIGVGTVNTIRPWEFQYDMDVRKTTLRVGVNTDPNSGFFQLGTSLDFMSNLDVIRFGERSLAGSDPASLTTPGRIILDPGNNWNSSDRAIRLGRAADASLMVEPGIYTDGTTLGRIHFGYNRPTEVVIGQSIYGGTDGGRLTLSNEGIWAEASDNNASLCAGAVYGMFADLSDAKWKKCQNGVLTDLDTTSGGGGDSIRVEDGDNAGTFTAMVDADFDDSGDIDFQRTGGSPDIIKGVVRADSVALTTDTTGNYVATVADGTGIDGTASGEGTTYTPTLDLTEVTNVTFSAGGSASFTHTFDVSGTDDVMTFGSGTVDFNGNVTASAFIADDPGDPNRGATFSDNTTEPGAPADTTPDSTLLYSLGGEFYKKDEGDSTNERLMLNSGNVTGDITFSAAGAGTIAADSVTYAKMQNVSATSRILGRITAGAGDTEELTGTQATTLLDAFTSSLKGLAPSSGGGTTNFLRADGTWAAPGGGSGDVTDVGPGCATGACFTDGLATSGTDLLVWEGTTVDTNELHIIVPADPGADINLTLPTATTTIVGADTSNTLTNKSYTASDGSLVDLSAVNASSTTEGLKLPQATSCASATAEGETCWDTDDDTLYTGNGTTASPATGTWDMISLNGQMNSPGSLTIVAASCHQWRVLVPARVVAVDNLHVGVTTSGAGDLGWALYTKDGATQLAHCNAIDTPTSSADATCTFTAVTLEPGEYISGVCSPSSPPVIAGITHSNMKVFGNGAQASACTCTSRIMPSTITPLTTNSTDVTPTIVLSTD